MKGYGTWDAGLNSYGLFDILGCGYNSPGRLVMMVMTPGGGNNLRFAEA